MLAICDQINEIIYQSIQSFASPSQVLAPVMEFSRHNGLYEFSQYSIALWAHLIKKKKYSPIEAMNVINFSMIPYYTVSQQLE